MTRIRMHHFVGDGEVCSAGIGGGELCCEAPAHSTHIQINCSAEFDDDGSHVHECIFKLDHYIAHGCRCGQQWLDEVLSW